RVRARTVRPGPAAAALWGRPVRGGLWPPRAKWLPPRSACAPRSCAGPLPAARLAVLCAPPELKELLAAAQEFGTRAACRLTHQHSARGAALPGGGGRCCWWCGCRPLRLRAYRGATAGSSGSTSSVRPRARRARRRPRGLTRSASSATTRWCASGGSSTRARTARRTAGSASPRAASSTSSACYVGEGAEHGATRHMVNNCFEDAPFTPAPFSNFVGRVARLAEARAAAAAAGEDGSDDEPLEFLSLPASGEGSWAEAAEGPPATAQRGHCTSSAWGS
ncbi:unnamed protein product, partial [Prorocentrum cordatum]